MIKTIDMDIELSDVIEFLKYCSDRNTLRKIRDIANTKTKDLEPLPKNEPHISLEDQLIIEHLQKAAKKYSLKEIEEKLPL